MRDYRYPQTKEESLKNPPDEPLDATPTAGSSARSTVDISQDRAPATGSNRARIWDLAATATRGRRRVATKREGIAVDRRLDAVRHARPLMETLPGWVPAAEREHRELPPV